MILKEDNMKKFALLFLSVFLILTVNAQSVISIDFNNYNEDQMMSNPEYQKKLMQSIADGLDSYFKK